MTVHSGTIPYYAVDAFSNGPFTGNPAGVCPLDQWLPDDTLQKIAAENNLAETAFFSPEDDGFRLRWFAPEAEVDLCGHATLATAHVLYEELGYQDSSIRFFTRSGVLTVERHDGKLRMNLPLLPITRGDAPAELQEGLGAKPLEIFHSMDWLCVFENENVVRGLSPNLELLKRLPLRAVLVTAPGSTADYVLRCFGPNVGIPEDPATGSAQSMLAPYWAARLDKRVLSVQQLSKRGARLFCEVAEARVHVAGFARTYLKGTLLI
jgi:PhzF family phenazine biosynthesis protein